MSWPIPLYHNPGFAPEHGGFIFSVRIWLAYFCRYGSGPYKVGQVRLLHDHKNGLQALHFGFLCFMYIYTSSYMSVIYVLFFFEPLALSAFLFVHLELLV
jgi:hypothetical protein